MRTRDGSILAIIPYSEYKYFCPRPELKLEWWICMVLATACIGVLAKVCGDSLDPTLSTTNLDDDQPD